MSTKQKIMRSAAALFVERGVAESTTRLIAEKAGFAEGTIYRHFESKEALAWQIFEQQHRDLARALQSTVDQEDGLFNQVQAMVRCFYTLADEDWLLFSYYLSMQHVYVRVIDTEESTPYSVILAVVQSAIDQKVIRQRDANVLASLAMGAVQQLAINKIYGRYQGALLEHVEDVVQAIWFILSEGKG